jgi:hypothetical protein
VPLGVLGNVRKESDCGGWQPLPSDFSWLWQNSRVEGAYGQFGAVKHGVKIRQQLFARRTRLALSFERGQLVFGKLVPFEIRDEPIRAAGYVPDVKTDGTKPMRFRPDLLRSEPLGERCEILARLLESIEHWREKRVDASNWAPKPGLGRSLHSINVALIYSDQSTLAQIYGE